MCERNCFSPLLLVLIADKSFGFCRKIYGGACALLVPELRLKRGRSREFDSDLTRRPSLFQSFGSGEEGLRPRKDQKLTKREPRTFPINSGHCTPPPFGGCEERYAIAATLPILWMPLPKWILYLPGVEGHTSAGMAFSD